MSYKFPALYSPEEMDAYDTMLDAVGSQRIFSVTAKEDRRFEIGEECDGYFTLTVTADELCALGQELIALARGNPPLPPPPPPQPEFDRRRSL